MAERQRAPARRDKFRRSPSSFPDARRWAEWSPQAAHSQRSAISRSESPVRAAASFACSSTPAAWVQAGQVLAVVDRSVQAQQAAQQSALIEAAKAQAALAQSDYDRAIALQSRGFISKAEIDSKKAARDAAYAQVKVTQAQLGATRAQIGQLNVVAPTSGLILARNVEIGQIVSPGSGALFRLAEGGAMEMQAQLAQQDLAYVHVGMPAQVTPVGSQASIAGGVWQVAPVIDPQSRLGLVRISFRTRPR